MSPIRTCQCVCMMRNSSGIVLILLWLQWVLLMVRPTQHKVMDTGHVYYEFHKIKIREQDEHLPAHLHKIWLMFNGIDTFIPFMKKEIGNIVNMGVVAMHQICDTYTSVKDLVGHIPILKNVTMAQMKNGT